MSQSGFSLTSAIHEAGQAAGIVGGAQVYRPSGSCLVSYPIGKGFRWSLAISLLCRQLKAAGIRFRLVNYGAYPFRHPRAFRGFAVLVYRGFDLG